MSTVKKTGQKQNVFNQYWALEPRDHFLRAIAVNCGVPRQTLGNRIKGKHKPARKSQVSKQIHTEAEKDVLVDWIQYRSETARCTASQSSYSPRRSPSHVERLLEIGVVSFRCTLSTKYSSPMVASIALYCHQHGSSRFGHSHGYHILRQAHI